MSPPYEVSVAYSEDTIRLAARRFLARYLFQHTLSAFVLIFCALIVWFFFLFIGWATSMGWKSPVAICSGAFFLFAMAYLAGIRYTRESIAYFKMLKNPVIVWVFAEETIAAKSDQASSEFRWNLITALWCFPEFWLFTYGKKGDQGYSTLPIAIVSDEVKQFIIEKVKSNGGQVKFYGCRIIQPRAE